MEIIDVDLPDDEECTDGEWVYEDEIDDEIEDMLSRIRIDEEDTTVSSVISGGFLAGTGEPSLLIASSNIYTRVSQQRVSNAIQRVASVCTSYAWFTCTF